MSPQKRRARVSGGELAFVDEGDGPAVVLLHGFPFSSYLWRHFVPALAGRFRALAPDLLGTGDSDKPKGTDLGIAAQAAYVAELLAGMGIDRYAAVGHGHGGGVAQLLALDHAGAQTLVVMDSPALGEGRAQEEPWRDIAAEPGESSMIRTSIEAMLDKGMRQRARLGEAELEEYLRPWSGREGVEAFARAANAVDGRGLAGRKDGLGRLDIPTMILWGEEDSFFGLDLAERLNDAIPTSTLGILPGCGHLLPEDAPETLAPMLYEYLRSRYLGAPHGHGTEGVVTIQLERRPPWIGAEEEDEE